MARILIHKYRLHNDAFDLCFSCCILIFVNHLLLIVRQVMPVADKSQQGQQAEGSNESTTGNETDITVSKLESNRVETKVENVSVEEPMRKNSSIKDPPVIEEASLEVSSDEGWQEANSKGRSGSGAGRKFNRRRPNLAKIKVNSEFNSLGDRNYGKEVTPQGHKAMPKTVSLQVSLQKHSKAAGMGTVEDLGKLPTKALDPRVSPTSISKVSSGSTTLTAIASKSLSYKDVAVAAPGTVLKPLLEKVEELKEAKTDTPFSTSTLETSENEIESVAVDDRSPDHEDTGRVDAGEVHESDTKEDNSSPEFEDDSSSPNDQEKCAETNGSKLSASAQPFSPGAYPLIHPINSVAPTSVYDVIASQGMLTEPVSFPSVAARVPCGPRSPMYYRGNHTFRMKHGFLNYQFPVSEQSAFPSARIMNPHAPEFVPRRAWQPNTTTEGSRIATSDSSVDSNPSDPEVSSDEKHDKKDIVEVKGDRPKKSSSDAEKAELARQILLSFIVKSVKHSSDTPNESPVSEKKPDQFTGNSAEAVANDSAIIKILYGNEGKTEMVSEAKQNKQTKDADANDGEGFVVVTKRRRNRQHFANGIGLYNQQSICASVR